MNGLPLNSIALAIPFFVAGVAYVSAVIISNYKYNRCWSAWRVASWFLGVAFALLAVIGPLADKAHHSFFAHMIGHLLLGMLGPLFMALAAPITLLLRTLPVRVARKITTFLKSKWTRVVTDPFVASVMNVGSLWILYTTNVYALMHEYALLHLFIHFHVFLAGYLYTISMISIDPSPHATSYAYRSIMLTLSLAGHGILSKYIYAYPPEGVLPFDAEKGGILMFYGGDAVEAIIIFILCLQWYRTSRPAVVAPH